MITNNSMCSSYFYGDIFHSMKFIRHRKKTLELKELIKLEQNRVEFETIMAK